MTRTPDDAQPDIVPLWAIPLNETDTDTDTPAPPPKPVGPVHIPDDDIQFLRFVLEIPPADYQPRLSRFDEAA